MIRWASSVKSFFSAATSRTWLCRVSESAENNYQKSDAIRSRLRFVYVTCLRFSTLPLMVRNSYLIEETVKLPDDC